MRENKDENYGEKLKESLLTLLIKSSLLIGSISTQFCGEKLFWKIGKTGSKGLQNLGSKQWQDPQIYRPEKYSRWGLSELPVDRPGRPPTVKNPTDRQRSKIRPLEPPVDRPGRPRKTESKSLNFGRPPRSPGTQPDQTCTSVHVGRPTRSTDFRVSRLIS